MGQLKDEKEYRSKKVRLNQQLHLSDIATCSQNLFPLLPRHIAKPHFLVLSVVQYDHVNPGQWNVGGKDVRQLPYKPPICSFFFFP
jgi:hypothetical protein